MKAALSRDFFKKSKKLNHDQIGAEIIQWLVQPLAFALM